MILNLRTTLRTKPYHLSMGVRKVSLSLDEDAFKIAEEEAAIAGLSLSAWVSQAIRKESGISAGLRGVAEYEAEFGAFTEEELRRADEELAAWEAKLSAR
jgi:hypothetical protein